MSETNFDFRGQSPSGMAHVGKMHFGGDDSLILEFKTERRERPKHDDNGVVIGKEFYPQDVVHIYMPTGGSPNPDMVSKTLTEDFLYERPIIAEKYRLWKAANHDALNGTPLSILSFLNQYDIEELAHHRIKSVEQLAGVSDIALRNISIPEIFQVREKARMLLQSQTDEAPFKKIQSENDALKKQLLAMQDNIDTIVDIKQKTTKAEKEAE